MKWTNIYKETEADFDKIHKQMELKRHKDEFLGKILGFVITYLLLGLVYVWISLLIIKTAEVIVSFTTILFMVCGYILFVVWNTYLRRDNWEPLDSIYVAKTLCVYVVCISLSVIAIIALQ